MSKPNLSKQPQNVASIPSKYPYIYPYRLPSGEVRFRVRIRKKIFAGKPLLEPINEVYHTLEQAKKRLYDLEFGNVLAERELYRQILNTGSSITITELMKEFYKKRLEKGISSKYYKSKIDVILRTIISTEDDRITKVANFSFTVTDHTANEQTKFGDFKVRNFDLILLNRYIEARKLLVKPQTISNEVVIISNALKDCHNLFSQLDKLEEPLKGFEWKSLKAKIVYRDKRIKPEAKEFIANLLLKRSRNRHYHDLFIFLHETGCRISEALAVKISDIDFEKRVIFVLTKKNNQPRFLGVSPELFPIIVERVKDKQQGERIFPYTVDTYESKLTRLRSVIVAQGIKFAWHDLRHNYITKNINKKNVLQIMHEMNINDMGYFQHNYLNVIQSEDAAIKVAQNMALTPQELANNVGHFGNLAQTQSYTHHAPPEVVQKVEEKVDLMDIVKQQQAQIAQLMEMLKKS